MRNPSLSRKSKHLPRGRIASPYDFKGETIWVSDSAYDALCVIELFEDKAPSPADKAERIYRQIFPCIQCLGRTDEYLSELLQEIVWEAFGLDITEGHKYAEEGDSPVFDFTEDAARIKASFLAYYGIDWDKARETLPYSDFLALISQMAEADCDRVPGSLPNFKTPLAQALYYRLAKPPKNSKYARELRRAFLEMREGLKLGAEKRGRAESANNAMAELFAAARRGA